jgi:hypothetical protein
MKKTSKILLKLGAVVILLLSASSVNAIGYSVSFDDAQGDVRDGDGDPTSQPNVDITHVKSYKEGQTVYFELKVAGSIISNSEEYIYFIEAGGTDAEVIHAIFSNGNATYIDQVNPQNSGEAEYTVEGNKLTIGVPVNVFSENIVLRANAAYGDLGTSEPKAIDIAPNDGGFSGEDGGEDDTGDDDIGDGDTGDDGTNGDGSEDTNGGTPGFETIVVLLALGLALIIFRRRKILY